MLLFIIRNSRHTGCPLVGCCWRAAQSEGWRFEPPAPTFPRDFPKDIQHCNVYNQILQDLEILRACSARTDKYYLQCNWSSRIWQVAVTHESSTESSSDLSVLFSSWDMTVFSCLCLFDFADLVKKLQKNTYFIRVWEEVKPNDVCVVPYRIHLLPKSGWNDLESLQISFFKNEFALPFQLSRSGFCRTGTDKVMA